MREFLELCNTASATALTAILNSMWQAIAVVAVTWLVLKLWPGLNAATRHLVWWGVLGVITVLPLAPWGVAQLEEWLEQPVNPAQFRPIQSAPHTAEPVAAPVAYTPAPAPRLAPVEVPARYWPLAAAAVWFLLFAGQTGRILWSYSYLRRVKRQAERPELAVRLNFAEWLLQTRVGRPVRLLVSAGIPSPMASGFVHPAVIVPSRVIESFSADELDQVILHELAHLERRDDWTNLLGQVAAAFLMLHPAAAWVLRRIEREREIACDDWVVATTGEARPYAACLARLMEICWTSRRAMLATGMATRASNLRERVEMLLRRDRRFRPRASVLPAILCGLALSGVLLASTHAPHWFAFAVENDGVQAPPAPPAAPVAPAAPTAASQPAQPPQPVPPEEAPAPPAPPEAATPAPRYRAFAEPAAPAAMPTPMAELPIAALAPRAPGPAPATPLPPAPMMGQPPVSPAPPVPPVSPRGSLLAALVAAGYGDLAVDDIIELKNQGVSADFILEVSRAGWGKLSTRQIIELRTQGVSPGYLARCRNIGIQGLTTRDVIELHQQGVKPDSIREIHALGFGPYDLRQCIEMMQQGVTPEFFRDLKDTGFTRLEVREIIEAHNNGLRGRDLREARKYGSNLSLRQIIKLKQAGVI